MDKYNAGKMVGRGGFGKAFLCSRVHDDQVRFPERVVLSIGDVSLPRTSD